MYMVNKELKIQNVSIRKVTKVTEGGRNFKFLAITVAGGNGEISCGIGKNKEVGIAITKAENNAKKKMLRFPVTSSGTIPHPMLGKYKGCIVLLWPAATGSGIKVGGALRKLFEVSGIKNIGGKIINGKSHLNVIYAGMNALSKLRDPISIAKQRGVTLEKVFNG